MITSKITRRIFPGVPSEDPAGFRSDTTLLNNATNWEPAVPVEKGDCKVLENTVSAG